MKFLRRIHFGIVFVIIVAVTYVAFQLIHLLIATVTGVILFSFALWALSGEKTYGTGFWQNPRYVLYSWWGELYTRWLENFNPRWREPLPPVPCQLCGRAGHTERFCPRAKELGFLPERNQE